MRIPLRPVYVLLAVAFAATAAHAASRFRKPYYKATVPGAWALTRSVNTVNGDVSEYRYARLADDAGRVVFETRYDQKTGQFAGTKGTNRYVLRAGFPIETDGPSYMRWVEKSAATSPDGEVVSMDEETTKAIAAGATDYGAIVVFKGTETVDGKACDHYTYEYDSGSGKVQGEYWLSEKVPFGVVKEVLGGTDATGARYHFETKLVESGVTPEIARGAGPAAATLAALYGKGKLSIRVEVLPGASRVRLTLTNPGEAPLDVVVPKGTTSLPCGTPVGNLVLVSDAERKLSIPGGEAAPPLELTQKGARRPTKGSFTISVYEGEPLFSGSVEMDSVKE